jgi:DNA-binding NarL/FixJ family response regulator
MLIVIAEDSAVVRAGLAETLADRGREVAAAVGNAEDLLAAVDEHRPDAAVVDVRMPLLHRQMWLHPSLLSSSRIFSTHRGVALTG